MHASDKKSCETSLEIFDDLDEYAPSGLKKDDTYPTTNRFKLVANTSDEKSFWLSPFTFEEIWKVKFYLLTSLLGDCLKFATPGKEAIEVNDSSRNIGPAKNGLNSEVDTQKFNTAVK